MATNGTVSIIDSWENDDKGGKVKTKIFEFAFNVTAGATPISVAIADFPGINAFSSWNTHFVDSAGAVVLVASVTAPATITRGNSGTNRYPTLITTANVTNTGIGYWRVEGF